MAGGYGKLDEMVKRLSLQLDILPKPLDKARAEPILRPLYERLSKLMGEDDGELFLHSVAQPPPAALSPPRGKRARLGEESPVAVSPLRPVVSPKDPRAPQKAGRKTRKAKKPKH
jgi:hypothetical protein